MKKILVVEESEDMRELVLYELEYLAENIGIKFDLRSSTNFEDSMKKIKDFSPDLVITGYKMSEGSGLDIFLEALKVGIGCIILTSNPVGLNYESIERGIWSKVAGCWVQKPFNYNHFEGRIRCQLAA